MKKFFLGVCTFFLFANVSFAAEEFTLVIQPGPDEGKDTVYGTSFFTEGRPDLGLLAIGGWGDQYYSFIEFDLSALPAGANVEKASLDLFQYKISGSENYGKIQLVTEDWNEASVNLSNNPSYEDLGDQWAHIPATEHWWNQDVTSIVSGWILETYSNFGIRIVGQLNDNNNGRRFYSSDYLDDPTLRPKLVITYTLPEEEKDVEELVAELGTLVKDVYQNNWIRRAIHTRSIDRIADLIEEGSLDSAEKRIELLTVAFLRDERRGRIGQDEASELVGMLQLIKDALEETSLDREVPLYTQTATEYPSESVDWANDTYANGVDSTYCPTIADCGCAITSLVMLARSYGVTEGVDGSDINPGNFNTWLEENNGYDKFGNLMWSRALHYFGTERRGQIHSYLSYDALNSANIDLFEEYLAENKPVITKTRVPLVSGGFSSHFIVSADIQDDTFGVRDPLWYNTQVLDDERERDSWVMDYNNDYSEGVRLIEFNERPQEIVRSIEIHLASPAELVLTDSDGNKIGYDPNTDTTYAEIDGEYFADADLYSHKRNESGEGTHETKILYLQNPTDDEYTLEVIGTDDGEYSVSVLTVDEGGESEMSVFSATTTNGHTDTYELEIAEDGKYDGHGHRLDQIRHFGHILYKLAHKIKNEIEEVD